MIQKPTVEIAYEILSKKKKEMSFVKLWEDVCKKCQYTEKQAIDKIASFYSTLMLDSRFFALPNNLWDLKSRRKYNETHIDTNNLIIDDDDREIDEGIDFDRDDSERLDDIIQDEEIF